MKYVNFCLEEGISKQINRNLKQFNYSSKTNFVRDAVKSKLEELEKKRREEKAWKALFKLKGAYKGKSTRFKTFEEWHDWRSNEGSEELFKELRRQLKTNQK
ncbi:MAG: hypothetical protein ABH821_04360 [archaeon]